LFFSFVKRMKQIPYKLLFSVLPLMVFLFCCIADDPFFQEGIIIQSGKENKWIVPLDSILIQSNPGEICRYDLDVDHDEIPDLQFVTDYDIHPGGGYCNSKVACLNPSISLSIEKKEDTTFIHVEQDTILYNNEWHIHQSISSSCRKLFPNDSIFEIKEKNHLIPYSEDDTLWLKNHWASDNYFLWLSNYYGLSDPVDKKGDTIYMQENSIIRDCDNWPFDSTLYLGFKIETNQEISLGWIRLKLLTSTQILLLDYSLVPIDDKQ